MKWTASNGVRFMVSMGIFEETPIGRINLACGFDRICARINRPDGSFESLELSAETMLEGLMAYYDERVPETEREEE